MKSVAVVAGFAATLAAAHAGHGHQHAHNKRGADGVFTSWDITTEWEYVTVTAGQAGPAGTGHAQGPSAAAPSAVQSQVTSAAQGGDEVSAAAVTSAPATGGASDPNAIQASKNAAQASINAAMAASNSAHQASMLSLQAGKTNGGSAPAQTVAATSAAAPVSSAVVASSSAAKPSSTGSSSSGGGPSGNCKTTFMTYYNGGGAFGSCGWPTEDNNNTVALAASDMGGTAQCGKKMKIYVDGDSTGHEAIATDTCGACASDGHVDVVQDWAFQIAGQAKLVAAGKLPIKYCWD